MVILLLMHDNMIFEMRCTFLGSAYTDKAELQITPKPDSMLRVCMVYQSLERPIDIPKQKLTPWERKGFAVVEWGGAELME